jgi:ATP-dependent helicase/nuclease subunit B
MAVQFILGRSGTGKTSCCIKSIIDELRKPAGRPLILLVPEQATYQAERAVVADERIPGYHRLHVLSFDRLQFLLSGKNTARPNVSRIARQMAVHRILLDNKDKLNIFKKLVSRPGLARRMEQTIRELNQYAKTPDDIRELLGVLAQDQGGNLAVLKFSDIALILEEYLKFIRADYLDPDIQLLHACRRVSSSALTKGAKLWVDGFAGFTGAELEVLTELLKASSHAKIALCLDPSRIDPANPAIDEIDPADLFYPTRRTYAELVARIKKCRLQLTDPLLLEKAVRFSACPALDHVERNIFNNEPHTLDSADNIRIMSAPNERAEADFVAAQILRLVKQKNYRYRDIAVIASDIDSYEHYVRASFADYGIPYFIDKRKKLNQHPVVQLISSALKVVTEGFSHGDIFACLKTDLMPIEPYHIDLLENYCLAFGITSDDWQADKQWSFADTDDESFDEQRINQIRLKAVRPLRKLRDALCPEGDSAALHSPEQFTRIIFAFLDDLHVKETLAAWIETEEKTEIYAAADEHQQFYNRLLDIFDELVQIFAGRTMPAEQFVEIINSAFSQLTLAFIPPTLDQVLVGSIERSRHPDLKAVFLVGACQRNFPVPLITHTLLTDRDRRLAESADFRLAAASGRQLAERQYLAYIAFTRPSQYLCVTYPSVDEKGAAVPRSQFIDNLQSLFENLCEESIAGRRTKLQDVQSENELTDRLCTGLGKDADDSDTLDKENLGRLLQDMCSDKRFEELSENVLSAVNYDNRAELNSSVVDGLFGPHIHSSATRLSTFAACPYRYFARYTLHLEKRKEFKFEPLDLGSFYHSVLDALLKAVNRRKRDFAAIENQELLSILKEQIQKVIQADTFISSFIRHSPHNAFIISSAAEVLEDCVLAIAQMVRAGSFRPAVSEVSFGRARDASRSIGKYELTLADSRSISFNGKIDRIDIAEIDGQNTALIFDYKRSRSAARFSWANLYHGLDIQLPLYMLALRNAARCEIEPLSSADAAGAFYMPIEVAAERAALDEIPKKEEKFCHKAYGIFNGEYYRLLDSTGSNSYYNFFVTKKGDQYGKENISGALRPSDFEKVLTFTTEKIIDLAEQIVSGCIVAEPYRLSGSSPCSYCEYQSVCRFDWQINDYNHLLALPKSRVLEMMDNV